MSDLKQELDEIMKEFNRHNLDAMVSMNYLKNTQVLHIDTTRHDREIYNKAIDDILQLKKQSHYDMTTDSIYQAIKVDDIEQLRGNAIE